jgi:hypothetical protein
MKELIEKLETAERGSYDLDEMIALATLGNKEVLERVPCFFTTKLDDKIVGEDIMSVSEQRGNPGEPVKWVAVHRMPKGKMSICATARTEALARRAAALKALEAKGEGSN